MSSPEKKITTFRSHLHQKQKEDSSLSYSLVGVLSDIALACKAIACQVRSARIEDVLGSVQQSNVHGEEQQKLDVLSNEIMKECLIDRTEISVLASEEEEEAVVLRAPSEGGEFCVVFDPLDGSSNIDVAVGVGTIFSVLRNHGEDADSARSPLQSGVNQVAAGYVLYGSSVVLVLTLGSGVDMYVLDPSLGSFVLVEENLRIPVAKKMYSLNEAYRPGFPVGYQKYLDYAHSNQYSCRYIGSMVADVHRTILKGGVFLYPPTENSPSGKLRLLYEANPMGFIVEQAGGRACTGSGRILEVNPEEIHQRVPVILGSPEEVDHVVRHLE